MKNNWPTKKLGEVLILYDNGIWGPEDLANGIPILRSTNFNNDGTVNFDNVALRRIKNGNLDEKKLRKGDILLERSGGGPKQPVGRVVYFNRDNEYYFGNFLTRFKPRKEVYSKFLFHFLFNLHQKGVTNALQNQTTGIRNLRFKEYLELEIPLPPIKIQKRIVARVEELFEKIDKAKELRQKAQEETATIFPSALQKIFEKAEKKWPSKKLEEISNVFSGSSAPQGQKYFENGKYAFVRVQDLGRCGKTKNLVEIKDKINNLALKDFHLVFAKKGTILFPKSGAAIFTNSRAILGINAYIVGHLAAIVPDQSTVLTDWIFYWLYQFDMAELTKTTSLPSLKLSLIKELKIPLPPLSEQKKIVAGLDNLREKVEKLKQFQQKQLEELTELKQSILNKAFKGEL